MISQINEFMHIISTVIFIQLNMLIIPSKEVAIISASENKEIFLFDPKTTAVIQKYKDDAYISSTIAYYPNAQQFVAPQQSKTFLNVWSTDANEPQLKISLPQVITVLEMSEDEHFIYAGTSNGNFYVWELPGGILLKKKNAHSSQIKSIIEYRNSYFITVSKNEIKLWPKSSFFIEADASIPLKIYHNTLEIISAVVNRNILIVLTQKCLTFFQCSSQSQSKEFQILNKFEFEFACSMCYSHSNVYIGSFQGNIDLIEIMSKQIEKQIEFSLQQGSQELQISKKKKRKSLESPSKHPITSLAFVDSLCYLISGNSQGEVTIWNNGILKKTLTLFKSSITNIKVISKPKDCKIPQQSKIRPLNKYELGKEGQLLDIMASKQQIYDQQRDLLQNSSNQVDQDERILQNMFQILKNPERMIAAEMQRLKTEKEVLMKANLHYCKMLMNNNAE